MTDTTTTAVLIDAPSLKALRDSDTAPVLLDVRWKLGDDNGREHYRQEHIPGAIYVDLNADLAAPASPERGRHPLPSVADLQAAVVRWGIAPESVVVVYDDAAGQSAARAWWLLRWAGLKSVLLLDGGLRAWRAQGFEIATGDEYAALPGTVILGEGHLPTADIDEVATATGKVVIDARAAERYRGEVEPVDPRAGHIPGALNVPTADNVDADGAFLPEQALRERFEGLGISSDTEVIVYCGSGVTAAHEIVALARVGLRARLFPGSWSQWSADATRPVATGESPADNGV